MAQHSFLTVRLSFIAERSWRSSATTKGWAWRLPSQADLKPFQFSRAHKPSSGKESRRLTVKSRGVKAPTTAVSASRQAKPPEPSPDTEERKRVQTPKALLWSLPRIL